MYCARILQVSPLLLHWRTRAHTFMRLIIYWFMFIVFIVIVTIIIIIIIITIHIIIIIIIIIIVTLFGGRVRVRTWA